MSRSRSRSMPVKTHAFTSAVASNSPSMNEHMHRNSSGMSVSVSTGTGTPTGSSNARRTRGNSNNNNHSNSNSQSHSHAPVSVAFETIVRIRPLLKKEREDAIVLEKLVQPIALPHSGNQHHQQQQQQQGSSSVVLHPLPTTQEPAAAAAAAEHILLSPSAVLVSLTLSPEAGARSAATSANKNHSNHHNANSITTAHDLEFQFDHALSADANQEKVYYSLGLPVALSVMEPLRRQSVPTVTATATATSCTGHGASANGASTNTSTSTPNAIAVAVPNKKTHLIIGMGVAGSGKTFTCWGGGPISKRAAPTDGLIPRFVDSLFSQSQHNLTKRKTETFGVNLSILQVNQSISHNTVRGGAAAAKHYNRKSDPNECTMHDLLQPINAKRSMSAAVAAAASSSSLSLHFGRALSGNASAGSHGGSASAGASQYYNSLDEPVSVEQDDDSPDMYTVNAQVRTCKTAEQAREALQTAVQNSRKLSNAKRYQSHVLVKLQPVLLDRHGRIVQSGGMVAVLDMAGADVQSTSNTRASKRSKDAIPSSRDAHAAIFHCLRTLQHNQQLSGGTATGAGALRPTTLADSDIESSFAYDSSASTDTTNNNSKNSSSKPSFGRQVSLKKVPYRQHQLTMLLQSLFSPKLTDQTAVTLLLAASPGHRDYLEKKILLTDLETFRNAPPVLATAVTTGVRILSPSLSSLSRKKNSSVKRERKKVVQQVAASDADDEGSLDHGRPSRTCGTSNSNSCSNRTIGARSQSKSATVPPLVCSVLSMTYSDDEDGADVELIPLPPPVAPTYLESPQESHSSRYNNLLSPAASLPLESLPPVKQRKVEVIDFPGVVIPKRSSSNTVSLKKEPHATKVRVVSSAPLEHHATISNTTKFSPMKTINKVVTASKKKGMKVMTTMDNYYNNGSSSSSNTSSNNKVCIPRDYSSPIKDVAVVDKDIQAHLKKLEANNDKFRRENVQLRDTNEELVRENQELRSKLSSIDRQGAANHRNKQSSSMHVDEPPAAETTIPHKNATHSLESSSSKQDENKWEPPPRRQQVNMMDDPMFQHMAQLSGKRQPSHKEEELVPEHQEVRSERSKNDHQGGINLKYSSSMHVDNNKPQSAVQATLPFNNVTRSRESFSSEQDEIRRETPPHRQQGGMMNDPLFQHMAHLSGSRQANSPWNVSSSTGSAPSSSHQGHFSLQVPSTFRSQY